MLIDLVNMLIYLLYNLAEGVTLANGPLFWLSKTSSRSCTLFIHTGTYRAHSATIYYPYLVVGFGVVRVVVRRFPRPDDRFGRAQEGSQVNSRFQLIRQPTEHKKRGQGDSCADIWVVAGRYARPAADAYSARGSIFCLFSFSFLSAWSGSLTQNGRILSCFELF